MKFETRRELDVHIIDEHKSHKPCRNFADNSCEYTENSCRFNHIILKQRHHLCYKCGDILARKSLLLGHIRKTHQDTWLKYLEGNCTYGIRCVYKHTNTIAQNVEGNHSEPLN